MRHKTILPSQGYRRVKRFKNVRLILLESIWKLFVNMEAQPHRVLGNQIQTSLKRCREWLVDWLNFIQDGHLSVLLFKWKNFYFEDKRFKNYISIIKSHLRNYMEYQTSIQVLSRQKRVFKSNLKYELKENVAIIDLAIQIMQLFNKTAKKMEKKNPFSTRGRNLSKTRLLKSRQKKKRNMLKHVKGFELPSVRTVNIRLNIIRLFF